MNIHWYCTCKVSKSVSDTYWLFVFFYRNKIINEYLVCIDSGRKTTIPQCGSHVISDLSSEWLLEDRKVRNWSCATVCNTIINCLQTIKRLKGCQISFEGLLRIQDMLNANALLILFDRLDILQIVFKSWLKKLNHISPIQNQFTCWSQLNGL